MDIPHEKQFHFADGTSIGSIDALRDKLESISYQEFYTHVNAEKNDFANWIRHVFKDERLADDLQKVTSIVETVEIINDYLVPRPLATGDLQSQIEDQVEVHPPMDIQEVPTTTPAAEHGGEGADLEILQEDMDAREPVYETHEEPAHEEPIHEMTLSPREKKMLMVKEFVFGMILGLFIGLLLGRVLSIG